MRRLRLIVALPIVIVVIALSVANRHDILINLSPMPWSISLPLYLLAFGLFVLGALAGGAAVWASGMRRRRRASGRTRPGDSQAGGSPRAASTPALRSP